MSLNPTKKKLNLKLRKFSFDMMGKSDTVAVIGKRKSGKSVLLRDLLYHFRDIPIGTVISPTEKLNKNYSRIVPPIFIHDAYRDDIVDKVLKRQRVVIENMAKDPNFADVDPYAFLLLDDCMFDDDWQKANVMKEIFYNGRHYKLMFILSLQYCMGLKIGMRNNLDWTFLFKEGIHANKRRLYEFFAGMFPNYAIFSSVLDQICDEYGCLVIHNGSTSTKLQQQCFWFKADNREVDGSWKCCLPEFWNLSDEKGAGVPDVDSDDDHDDFDKPFYGSGRNALAIDVRKQY